jgi:hypothetical protein
MTALPRNYDAWRLQGPPEPRIVTEWDDTARQWAAWDDVLGADTSPVGWGTTQDEAVDDLMWQLEDAHEC